MIKLYDPNEKKKTEYRIDVEEFGDEINLNIVDLDGNIIETFASITKRGMELYKTSPEYTPFSLTTKNYISTKYVW